MSDGAGVRGDEDAREDTRDDADGVRGPADGPLVSVLLPARDAADTLGAALRSVARQTAGDWECVVVDDGSTDATLEVAREAARRDRRFVVLARPARGLLDALATGLARCRGQYVARMDADDVMHRERLALQAAALDADASLTAVGSHVRLFPRARLTDGMARYERWLNAIVTPDDVAREAFVECPIAHPTLTARRETLVEFGYRDEGWPEDHDLLLRLLAAGHRLGVVPRRLLGWRDGPVRLSRVDPRYALERFTACKAAHLARGLLAADDHYVLWGYGDTGRALRKALLAHERRPVAIVELHPGRLGQTIHGAPVIAPAELDAWNGHPLVASVAGADARARIRARLAELGRVEGEDFVVAA